MLDWGLKMKVKKQIIELTIEHDIGIHLSDLIYKLPDEQKYDAILKALESIKTNINKEIEND